MRGEENDGQGNEFNQAFNVQPDNIPVSYNDFQNNMCKKFTSELTVAYYLSRLIFLLF